MTARPARIGAALVGAAILGSGAVQAGPDGWTLVGSVSEELRVVSNPRLTPGGGGDPDLRATTRLGATLTRSSPTASLSLTGGISPVLAEDAPEDVFGFLAPSMAGRLLVQGKRVQFDAQLNGSLSSTAFTDTLFGFDENGDPDLDSSTLVTGTANRLRLNGNAGLSWVATARDSFSLRASIARTDFFDGSVNLVPTLTLGLDGGWRRALTQDLGVSISAGLRWFEADNLADTRSVSLSLGGGMDYAFSDRLSMNAGLQVGLTRTTEGTPSDTDFAANLGGSFGLTYAGPDDSLRFVLSQGIQPSSLGSLQNTTVAGLRYNHAINTVSGLGIDARFQLQSPIGGGSDSYALRIGPYYNYRLDAETSLTLGYGFEMTNQSGGTAQSHAVFLTLRRGFNLLQ